MFDYIVVFIYISFIFTYAFLSSKKSGVTSLKAQYLANQEISFFDSLLSIIATEVSALTFIGIPAFAFAKDFSFIYIYFGAIFGRIIIASWVLPKVYNQGLTLYEVIAKFKSSGKESQMLLSLYYMLGRVLGVGVRLYAGSILISEFFEVSSTVAILSTAGLTFIYTAFGGLKTVIFTDRLQFFLFVFGGICAHFVISSISPRDWSDLMWEG